MNKSEKLKKALANLLSEGHTEEAIITLMQVTHQVMGQGSGLLWEDVRQIIKECIE